MLFVRVCGCVCEVFELDVTCIVSTTDKAGCFALRSPHSYYLSVDKNGRVSASAKTISDNECFSLAEMQQIASIPTNTKV